MSCNYSPFFNAAQLFCIVNLLIYSYMCHSPNPLPLLTLGSNHGEIVSDFCKRITFNDFSNPISNTKDNNYFQSFHLRSI